MILKPAGGSSIFSFSPELLSRLIQIKNRPETLIKGLSECILAVKDIYANWMFCHYGSSYVIREEVVHENIYRFWTAA